jgi:hypothetical protein
MRHFLANGSKTGNETFMFGLYSSQMMKGHSASCSAGSIAP